MNGCCYHAAFLIWGNPQCFGARPLTKGNPCAYRIGARTESPRSRCENSGTRSTAYSNPSAPKTQQESAREYCARPERNESRVHDVPKSNQLRRLFVDKSVDKSPPTLRINDIYISL